MIFSNTGLSNVLTFGARTNLQTLNCLCKIYPIVPVHEYYTIGVNLYYQNKLLHMDQCLELTSYHGYLLPRIYLQRQRSFKGVGGNNGQTASIRRQFRSQHSGRIIAIYQSITCTTNNIFSSIFSLYYSI